MTCPDLTVEGTSQGTLKAVEFSPAWADVLNDLELKAIARFAILEIGDELLSEPVHRENGYAYVLFTPSTVKYVSFNIVTGLTKAVTALANWIWKNPGKSLGLLAVFTLAYWGIKIVDWQTKKEEAIAKTNDCVTAIMNNSSLTSEEKLKAIAKCGGAGGTDWGTIAIGAAALLGLAYIFGSRRD